MYVMTATHDNKASLVRAYEVMSSGNLNDMDEFIAADYVNHNPSDPTSTGREGLRALFAEIRSGFSDFRIHVHDVITEDDIVVARVTFSGTHTGSFAGAPATGKPINMTGIDIIRYRDGKAVERWGEFDNLSLLQQLGVIPTPG
jgi:steroid delta-isomerase-like uncharacterized protein